jgi:hypothetical protein
VPSGAIILSGQNTTAISVLWGLNSGNISVAAANSCGNSPASLLAVTLSPAPPMPGPISGPSTICANTTNNFSIAPVSGGTINWTVPPDATISSGQGTEQITVIWGLTAGNVSVTTGNSCGISMPSNLYVATETIPAAAQSITGSDTVCQGYGGYQFSIPAISNATSYQWSLPQGASISQGQGTNSIQVDFSGSAVSGSMTASGSNLCGTGPASSIDITVMVCTGITENQLLSQIIIYPNPVHGLLNIAIRGAEKQLSLKITDLSGHLLYKKELANLSETEGHQIDVSGFAAGVYLVKLQNDSRVYLGKFTVK